MLDTVLDSEKHIDWTVHGVQVMYGSETRNGPHIANKRIQHIAGPQPPGLQYHSFRYDTLLILRVTL